MSLDRRSKEHPGPVVFHHSLSWPWRKFAPSPSGACLWLTAAGKNYLPGLTASPAFGRCMPHPCRMPSVPAMHRRLPEATSAGSHAAFGPAFLLLEKWLGRLHACEPLGRIQFLIVSQEANRGRIRFNIVRRNFDGRFRQQVQSMAQALVIRGLPASAASEAAFARPSANSDVVGVITAWHRP